MKIGNRAIGKFDGGQKTFIIAEAGVGFACRDMNPVKAYRNRIWGAQELARQAQKAGADAVKFQMFIPDEPLFCSLEGDEERWGIWQDSFLDISGWRDVKGFCENIGIIFLASAFQPTAVEWLKELKVDAYKVASRAANTYPYDSVPGPFIVSTGGTDGCLPKKLRDLEYTHHLDWRCLQCDSEYPCSPRQWETGDGLSDHSGTIGPGLHAIAYGAEILEVHFKLKDGGPDDAVSLSVDDLTLLCRARDEFAKLRNS